jgi:hypothetical protein
VTIAKRPFVRAGMAKDMQVIWVKREQEYFCREDWTGSISLIPFNKSRWARRADEPSGPRQRASDDRPPRDPGSSSLADYLHCFSSADRAQPGNFPGLLNAETTFASKRETLLSKLLYGND